MGRRIVLLRAVNVGGAKLPMADLREIAGALGATEVSTFIASGNLICTVPGEPAAFDRALEKAVEERFGYFREVISRTPEELAVALAAYPFERDAEQARPKFSYLHVLVAAPTPAVAAAFNQIDFGADRAAVSGDIAYLHYGEGAGTSKLTPAVLVRRLGVQGTARNLNPIAKLIELAS
jgi:uncharacterized protein (DUF1697 family)